MDLKKVDLNELQDYAFTANEIAMSGMTSRNSKFINIKCLDNESIIPTVKAIPLDHIKQAREEIDKLDTKIAIRDTPQGRESYFIVDQAEVLKILDKLIEESEEK